MIRPMTQADTNDHSARIIYQTDDDMFPFIFGKESVALPRLKTLMELEQNSFSHRWAIVDEVDDDMRGVLMAYPPSEINAALEAQDMKVAFEGVVSQVLLQIKAWFLESFMDQSDRGDLYIQNICVHAEHRGKGIGSALINACLDEARKSGRAYVTLDVNPNNPGAKRLYERIGFTHSRFISIPIINEKVERLCLAL